MRFPLQPIRLSCRSGMLPACFALASALSSTGYASAQSASAIFSKMQAHYNAASSFSATISLKQAKKQGKPIGTIVTLQHVLYRTPNMFRVETTANGSGGMSTVHQHDIRMSDGKLMVDFDPATKKYLSRPAPPKLTAGQILGLAMAASATAHIKLLPQSHVGARAVWVVEVPVPPLPATISPQQRGQITPFLAPTIFYIDKSTNECLRIVHDAPAATTEVTFTSQAFNSGASPSLFHFVPPKGATQVQAPKPGAPPH